MSILKTIKNIWNETVSILSKNIMGMSESQQPSWFQAKSATLHVIAASIITLVLLCVTAWYALETRNMAKAVEEQVHLIQNPPPKKPNLQIYSNAPEGAVWSKSGNGYIDFKIYIYNAGDAPCFEFSVFSDYMIKDIQRIMGDDIRKSMVYKNGSFYLNATIYYSAYRTCVGGDCELDLDYLYPGEVIPLKIILMDNIPRGEVVSIKATCDKEEQIANFNVR